MWALAKIKAYQSIKEPFIHVDGDVFIWTKIDESLRDHELIVQNEETTTGYYGKMWRDIRHAISYMPEEMKRYDLHIDNKAYNMGILGGTDIDFIQRYTYKEYTTECTSLLEQDYMRKLVLGKVQLPKKISVLMREVTSLGKSWELQQLLSTNLNNSY